jgi:hypothetical protein
MEIDPPESAAGRLGVAAGIVTAGAAIGGAAGAPLPILPQITPKAKGLLGAAFGAAATAVGAFAASEFLGGDWADVEKDTAIIGAGLVGAVGLLNMLGSVGTAAASVPAPALPAAGSQNYTATIANSGGTLNVAVGDTLTVTLVGTQADWTWQASSGGQVKWLSASESTDGSSVSYVFAAVAAGTAQIVATPANGGTTNFTATINVG